MCSIFGAIGSPDPKLVSILSRNAEDRGRDGKGIEKYQLIDGRSVVLGNCRAAPTTELQHAKSQPYSGFVHNGTIANDKELAKRLTISCENMIDSEVFALVTKQFFIQEELLGFQDETSVREMIDATLSRFSKFLSSQIIGSYALAALAGKTVFLACNYKPVHYWSPDGETVYFSSMARHFKGVVSIGQAPVMMDPYSVMDLTTFRSKPIKRKTSKRAIVIASAGLDSTVVATKLKRDGYEILLLHFDYGCLATSKEKALIPKIAEYLDCPYEILPLDYSKMQGGSKLFGSGEDISGPIEGAEFAHEWVPCRNLFMIAKAAVYAEANSYHHIALGNNLEEGSSFADNEEQMTIMLDRVMNYAVSDGYELRIISPVGHLMKHEIVKLGMGIKAPFHLTYSCYKAGKVPCGNCGPDFMRKEAFARNGWIDPVFQPDFMRQK